MESFLVYHFVWGHLGVLKDVSELLRQVTQNFEGSLFRSLRFLELLKARSLHFEVIPFHFFCRKIGRPQFLTLLLLRHDVITLKKNHVMENFCLWDIGLFSGSSCRVDDTLFSRQPCTDTRRTYHLYPATRFQEYEEQLSCRRNHRF